MKKIIWFSLLTAFAFLSPGCGGSEKEAATGTSGEVKNGEAPPAPATGPFKVKSAKIVYNYTSPAESGTDTFWFDDYGNTCVYDVKHEMIQFRSSSHVVYLWRDKKGTVRNYEQKAESATPYRFRDTEAPPFVSLPEEQRAKAGFTKVGNESVAGKDCEVWEQKASGYKVWLWNHVELKSENNGLQKTATSVEENITIPAEVWEMPAGFSR